MQSMMNTSQEGLSRDSLREGVRLPLQNLPSSGMVHSGPDCSPHLYSDFAPVTVVMSDDVKETMEFIEGFKSLPILWDQNNKYFRNRTARMLALAALGEKCNIDKNAVEGKIRIYRSYFYQEHAKVITKRTDDGIDTDYVSPWVGYKPLLFLLDFPPPRNNEESEDTSMGDSYDDHQVNIPSSSTANVFAANSISMTPEIQLRSDFPRPMNIKRTLKKREKNMYNPGDKSRQPKKFAANNLKEEDEPGIFAKMVAAKIRKLNPHNQVIAENGIQNYLFDIQMKQMIPPPPQLALIQPATTSYPSSTHKFHGHAHPNQNMVLSVPPTPAYTIDSSSESDCPTEGQDGDSFDAADSASLNM